MGVTQTSEVSSFRRRMKHNAMPLSLLRRSGAGSGRGIAAPRRAITAHAASRRCALPGSMCTRSSTRCPPNIASAANGACFRRMFRQPMSSVRSSFDPWSRDGTFVNINDTLRQPARHALDCNLAPSISVLDSQSTTTTEAGGKRGDDGEKRSTGANGNSGLIRTGSWGTHLCIRLIYKEY